MNRKSERYFIHQFIPQMERTAWARLTLEAWNSILVLAWTAGAQVHALSFAAFPKHINRKLGWTWKSQPGSNQRSDVTPVSQAAALCAMPHQPLVQSVFTSLKFWCISIYFPHLNLDQPIDIFNLTDLETYLFLIFYMSIQFNLQYF